MRSPADDWKYGTVLRRRGDVLAMVVARIDRTNVRMTLLADPKGIMLPGTFYTPGTVFNWAAGFGSWEVVDDT